MRVSEGLASISSITIPSRDEECHEVPQNTTKGLASKFAGPQTPKATNPYTQTLLSGPEGCYCQGWRHQRRMTRKSMGPDAPFSLEPTLRSSTGPRHFVLFTRNSFSCSPQGPHRTRLFGSCGFGSDRPCCHEPGPKP